MNTSSDTILQALKWRYATQVFDPTKLLTAETLHTILESARLAPSSFGIEAWKFIVIENQDIRVKLRAAGYDQTKITEAPALVLIAHRTDMKENISKERIERTAKILKQDPSAFDGLKQMIDMSMTHKSDAELEAWSKAQTYIALGIMIETAALLGVDSGPMEGFDANAFDEILGLKEKNLHATSLLALGYRGSDPAAQTQKVRRNFDDVVEFVK